MGQGQGSAIIQVKLLVTWMEMGEGRTVEVVKVVRSQHIWKVLNQQELLTDWMWSVRVKVKGDPKVQAWGTEGALMEGGMKIRADLGGKSGSQILT